MAEQDLNAEINEFNQSLLNYEIELIKNIREDIVKLCSDYKIDVQKVISNIDPILQDLIHASSFDAYDLVRLRLLNILDDFPEDNNEVIKIKHNLDALTNNAKKSYLDAGLSRRVFLDAAWGGAGFLLIAAASILSVAFPALLVPAAVLGGLVLVYTFIDTLIRIPQFLKEKLYPKIGDKSAFKPLQGDERAPREVLDLFKNKENSNSLVETGAKVSAAGLGLAILSLLVLFIPVLALPPVGGIILALVSIVAIAWSTKMLATNYFQIKKEIDTLATNLRATENSDERFYTEVIDETKVQDELNLAADESLINDDTQELGPPTSPKLVETRELEQELKTTKEGETEAESDLVSDPDNESPPTRPGTPHS